MNRDFKINFIIHSPFPDYVSHIGGALVPHTLANEISKLGENVYLYANSTNKKYNVTCIPWGTEIEFDERNTIVIFISGAGEHTYEHQVPEYLKNCPNIVRWLVNHQVKLYPKENKLYTYHKYWEILDGQKVDGDLSVIEIDHELFTNRNLNRSGGCYLIKGNLDTEQNRIIHSQNDFCIDSVLYNIPDEKKMEFLSNIFNEKEYFISYTPYTFTSVLAAMCGCTSIVVPKKQYGNLKFNKDKWLNDIWCSKYGIAVGLEDLDRAKSTMPLVYDNIREYETITQPKQINNFINDCYNWLKIKYNI